MRLGVYGTGTDSAGGYEVSRVRGGRLSGMSYLDAIRQADNEEQTADSRLQLLAGEETEEEVTQKDTERPQAARIYDAVTAGKESPSACIREVPKVPYGNLAQDGVINYNGICFVCDERTNSICLGNMEEKDKVINITLSGGGHLRVNRDNISDLAKAAGMFSPEDLNLIMRAIARDTKIQSMKQEMDDMKANVGNSIGAGSEAARTAKKE